MDAQSGLSLLGSILVSAPLTYSAVSKLLAGPTFARALANYRIFPERTRSFIARVVPWIELSVAAVVLVGAQWGSFATATAIYAGFGLVLFIAWRRGASGDCGCLGDIQGAIGASAVLRALALALLSGFLAAWHARTPAAAAGDGTLRIETAVFLVAISAVLNTAVAAAVSQRRNEKVGG